MSLVELQDFHLSIWRKVRLFSTESGFFFILQVLPLLLDSLSVLDPDILNKDLIYSSLLVLSGFLVDEKGEATTHGMTFPCPLTPNSEAAWNEIISIKIEHS